MSDLAIRVVNLGKRYRIGLTHRRHNTLRDLLTDRVQRFFRPQHRLPASGGREVIWALKDVSFEVKRGEILGIIGPNGSGKSTLLKVLSRVTEPTSGYAQIKGQLGALLEIGTGFHPELTGRENIFLNGAILGMKKAEITRKFDEIVAFAEVEKFLDTPVKHYSSGMFVRLAFSVAAHLEPEILLVDEVLAVGDAAFQKKCLKKMREMMHQGRTIILVSHNMASIEFLCQRAILLYKGHIELDHDPISVITHYLGKERNQITSYRNLRENSISTDGRPQTLFQSIRLLNQKQEETPVFRIGDDIIFEIGINDNQFRTTFPRIGIIINDEKGLRVCNFKTSDMTDATFPLGETDTIRCYWQDCRLSPGIYAVTLTAQEGKTELFKAEEAISFEVYASDAYGTGRLAKSHGVFLPIGYWDFRPTSVESLSANPKRKWK